MPINIYAYNTTYTLPTEAESTSKVTTPSLMFRKGGVVGMQGCLHQTRQRHFLMVQY